jgi:hypothetical protein
MILLSVRILMSLGHNLERIKMAIVRQEEWFLQVLTGMVRLTTPSKRPQAPLPEPTLSDQNRRKAK